MASNNNLLGSGKNLFEVKTDVVEEKPAVEEVKEEIKEEVNTFTPCWRYHSTCPQGRIVTNQEELDYLESQGWRLMIPR